MYRFMDNPKVSESQVAGMRTFASLIVAPFSSGQLSTILGNALIIYDNEASPTTVSSSV
ncbi:hypothetical protein HYE68_005719 [Fusarium pseudograminearum]|nr:hypothetical protein HYE68_005719 [Fusarium pseudograminearum]